MRPIQCRNSSLLTLIPLSLLNFNELDFFIYLGWILLVADFIVFLAPQSMFVLSMARYF